MPGKPLRFTTADGKTTEIAARGDKPVSFRLKASKKGIEVAVLDGKARIDSAGQTLDLDAKQSVEIGKKGKLGSKFKLPDYPALLAPGVDQRLHPQPKIALRWTAVAAAARYRVQVSHFIGFDEKLINATVKATSIELRGLKPELYVWRVTSIDEQDREGEFGFARRFSVLPSPGKAQPAGTAMLQPANKATVEYVKGPRPISFAWQGKAKGRYVLKVGRTPKLRRGRTLKKRVRGINARLSGLKPGRYFWGVFELLPNGKSRPLFEKPFQMLIVQRTRPDVDAPSIDWK